MRTRRGFIGKDVLLVLVLVVVVALAIVFPNLEEFGRKWNRVTCQDNLALIARAVRIYASDHGGTLPVDFEKMKWAKLLLRMNNWSTISCPSGFEQRRDRGYGYNRLFNRLPEREAQTIFVWDGKDITQVAPLETMLAQLDFDRHSAKNDRGVNLVCYDGHVKWTKKKDIKLEDFGP